MAVFHDCGDQAWGDHVAVVGHCIVEHQRVYRCDLHGITVRHLHERQGIPCGLLFAARVFDDGFESAVELHVHLPVDTQRMDEVDEPFRGVVVLLVDDFDETDVRGVFHDAQQVGLADGVGVLDKVFASAHLIVVAAVLGTVHRVVEPIARLVDECHERNQLEGGTRFAAHRDGVVFVVAYGTAVARQVGNSPDFARLHLHDDGRSAGGVLVENLFAQFALHDVLHVHVDGRQQVASVFRLDVLFRDDRHPDVAYEADAEVPSVAARKRVVERSFQSEFARLAERAGREGPVGFVAFRILRIDESAAEPSLVEDGEGLYPVELYLVYLVAYQTLVLAARAAAQGFRTDFAQPPQEIVFRIAGNGPAEAVGQCGAEAAELLVGHVEYGEVQRQVVGGGVGGEDAAVVRVDVAARGGYFDGLVALQVGTVAQGSAVGAVLRDEYHGEDGDGYHGEDGVKHPHARHDASLDILLVRIGRIVSLVCP